MIVEAAHWLKWKYLKNFSLPIDLQSIKLKQFVLKSWNLPFCKVPLIQFFKKNSREDIKEEDGLIQGSIQDIILKAKRKRQAIKRGSSRLGMMRHLYIILDCSEAMTVPDLKPTRHLCTLKMLEAFITEFFDQNPISQLGIITTKNKRAEKVADLAGNYKNQIKIIQGWVKLFDFLKFEIINVLNILVWIRLH